MFQSCFFGNFPQSGFFGGLSFFHVPLREHVVDFALHVFPLQEKNVYLVVILSIDNAARTFFKDSIHSGYVILETNIARNGGFTRAKSREPPLRFAKGSGIRQLIFPVSHLIWRRCSDSIPFTRKKLESMARAFLRPVPFGRARRYLSSAVPLWKPRATTPYP